MKNIIMIMMALVLSGCSTMKVETYKDTRPALKIEEYFAGHTKASGLFQDRFGTVRKRFDVDIHGTWNKDSQTLTLVEDFVYDDKTTEQRIWTIVKTGPDTYTGSAANVIGKAAGKSAGNAFNFKYDFRLAVGDKRWNVAFDDWMFLQPDGKTMFNKATITRWGFRIGDTYIFFRK